MIKTNTLFKNGFMNPFLRGNSTWAQPYVAVFRSGVMPASNDILRQELANIDANVAAFAGNWRARDPKFICAMAAYTVTGSQPHFELGGFTSGINQVKFMGSAGGVATHALLFPCGTYMNVHYTSRTFLAAGSVATSAARGNGSCCNDTLANVAYTGARVNCLVDPCDKYNFIGIGGVGPACIVMSIGATGSTDPMTVADVNITPDYYPVVTRCTFAFS